jgi:hypothetical protein
MKFSRINFVRAAKLKQEKTTAVIIVLTFLLGFFSFISKHFQHLFIPIKYARKTKQIKPKKVRKINKGKKRTLKKQRIY